MEVVNISRPSQKQTMAGVWQAASKHNYQEKRGGWRVLCSVKFNIPDISAGQADSAHLPRKTYGIQLKGSSFSKTVSLSLNFLRRSVGPCFRLEKKKKKELRYYDAEKSSEFSQDTATFHLQCCSKVCLLSKMWANLRHHLLPFSSRVLGRNFKVQKKKK